MDKFPNRVANLLSRPVACVVHKPEKGKETEMTITHEYQVKVDGITQGGFATQEGADEAVKHLIKNVGVEAERITVVRVEAMK